MKNCSNGFLVFLLLTVLLSCCSTYARLLPSETGSEQKLMVRGWSADEIPLTASIGEDFSDAEENCDEKDEECMRRRMLSDAHLDYIYNQNHKP